MSQPPYSNPFDSGQPGGYPPPGYGPPPAGQAPGGYPPVSGTPDAGGWGPAQPGMSDPGGYPPSSGMPDPGWGPPSSGMPDPGYVQPGGYPQQGFPQYPQPGYPQPGFPQPGGAGRNKGLLLGGIGAVVVLVLVAAILVVVLSKDDDKSPTSEKSPTTTAAPSVTGTGKPTSTRSPTVGGGKYEAPPKICDDLEMKSLEALFGAENGDRSHSRSEYESVNVGCGVLLGRGSTMAIVTISASYNKKASEARSYYDYELDSAKKTYAKTNGVQEVRGLGEKAMVYLADKTSSSSASIGSFRLIILDDNLVFSVRLMGSVSGIASWSASDQEKAFNALAEFGKTSLEALGS